MAKKFILESGYFKMSASVDFHFELAHDRKKVIGGGRWHLDNENKCLYLWDQSQDFGPVQEKELKEHLAETFLPRLSGYRVLFSKHLSDTFPGDDKFTYLCEIE